MKYMNNHYGQSRIFSHVRCRFPMQLQFFASDAADGGAGAETDTDTDGGGAGGSTEKETGESKSDNTAPSVEELLAQLAEERAKSARLQNEKDNASSEAANFKKQLRAKMTADEQAEAAKAEAEAAKDAKIQELETKFRVMEYSKRFMGIGADEATATELAGLAGEFADADKFFSRLSNFVKVLIKKAGDDRVEELVKSNPNISGGNGDADKETEADRIAKESAARRSGKGFNEDSLKQWI